MNEAKVAQPKSKAGELCGTETASVEQPTQSEAAPEAGGSRFGVSVEVWAALTATQRVMASRKHEAYAAMDRACDWTLTDDAILHISHHDNTETRARVAVQIEGIVEQLSSHFERTIATLSEEERIQTKLELLTRLIGTDAIFSSRAMRRIIRNTKIDFEGARAVEQEYALDVIDDLVLLFGFISYHDSNGLALSDRFIESFKRSISAASRVLTGDFEERDYEFALVGGDLVMQSFDCIEKWHPRYQSALSAAQSSFERSMLETATESAQNKGAAIEEIVYRELTAILGSAPKRNAVQSALATSFESKEKSKKDARKRRYAALVNVVTSAGIAATEEGIAKQIENARTRKEARDSNTGKK